MPSTNQIQMTFQGYPIQDKNVGSDVRVFAIVDCFRPKALGQERRV
ncbi:hypothetical protein N9S22_03500 [Paracoccaceae bacterium]|nr:hypothetical protein [Paracoccaceae bacterium]